MIYIENIHIDDNVYPALLRLLHNKTGLNFEYYRRNHIEKRLMARMIRVKCKTLQSYYDYLFSNEEEFRKFLDSFNINYTFFFRDWEVYDTFQNIFIEGLNCKRENIINKIKPKHSQLTKFRINKNYLKNQARKKRLGNNLEKKSNLTQYFPQFSSLWK